MRVRFDEEGHVTTWPALRERYTAGEIRAQLAANRWRRWGRAIVLHNGPLNDRERWFVARAHGSRGALLTSFTALELVGLTGWTRPDAHVLTRRGSRTSSRSPVQAVFHEVRDWGAVRKYQYSFTHIPRQAAVVAAGSLPNPRSACGLVVAAVHQGITAAASVRGVLASSPNVRHRHLLLLTLDDVEQGAQALSEIDFTKLCRTFGLPPPIRQAVRREPSGKRRYLDATWRRPDGRTLAAEVDGALHLGQRRWWDDQDRQNEIVLADTVMLRYPSVVVRTEPEKVADQLRRGLQLPS